MIYRLQNFVPIAAILLASLSCASTSAQEAFDSAFESSGLPWYDESSGGLKQDDAPDRPNSAVSNRNRIPPFQTKKKGQQKPKATNAPAPAGPAAATSASTIGTTLVYIAGAAVAILVIALLVYGFLKLESEEGAAEDAGKRKRRIRDHIRHLPFEIEEQDGDFETFAEKSLRSGDYSKAIIYLFADLLVAMSEADAVRLQRGKTNRQYLDEIWDHAEVRPYYRKVMTAFEDAFFGKHEIEKSRAEECFSQRPEFDAALEKIKQSKFAASQTAAVIPTTSLSTESV